MPDRSHPPMQAAPAVAGRATSSPPPRPPVPPVPRRSAPKRAGWRERWMEQKRKAREASIRMGVYNPGNWEPNPDYEPDREKAMADLAKLRAEIGPVSSSTPIIRRSRELDWGDDSDE